MSRDIIELLKPIYKELSSNELHAKIHNQNESLNRIIYKKKDLLSILKYGKELNFVSYYT